MLGRSWNVDSTVMELETFCHERDTNAVCRPLCDWRVTKDQRDPPVGTGVLRSLDTWRRIGSFGKESSCGPQRECDRSPRQSTHTDGQGETAGKASLTRGTEGAGTPDGTFDRQRTRADAA